MPGPGEIQTALSNALRQFSEESNISINGKRTLNVNVLFNDLGGITIAFPSGTETPSASSVSSSGTVTEGKLSVTFTTSSDFIGTILGVSRQPSVTYSFSICNPGSTLGAIVYTVTAGSIIIDITT